MSEKLKLIVLSGLPGAGKSTKARKLSTELGAIIIGRDEVRRNFLIIGEDELTIRLVQLARSFLQNGISTIIDSANLHPVDRERWTELAVETRAHLRWIHLDVPVDECIRRDAGRSAPNGARAIRSLAAQNSRQLVALERTSGTQMSCEMQNG